MLVSEARLAANQSNSKHSKGPVTEEGKAVSRRNSLKHGLTGAGVVLNEGDQAEVERRVESLTDELDPQTTLGSIAIRKIAVNSVKSERAAALENASIAGRVRNAVHAYDEERGQHVDGLFEALPDDPRGALRNLRRMPEGVDRLLEAWHVLGRKLEYQGPARWGSPELARAANLVGYRGLNAHDTRFGELSTALWGEFYALAPHEGAGLDDNGRREWARAELKGLIDAQIAELEAHRGTLDFDRIEQDRREAPARSTFDDSKEAQLARRYEADADRSFYKAMKEFRQVQAEAEARIEAQPAPSTPDPIEARMGSFCETSPPADPNLPEAFLDEPSLEKPPVKTPKRRRSGRIDPLPPPG